MVSRAGGLLLETAAAPRRGGGLSLRTEVLLSLGLLVAFAITLNAALFIKLWERDLVARRAEALSALAAAVQAAAPSALRGEGKPLEQLLPELAPEWAGLAVYGPAGRLKAVSGPSVGTAATPAVLDCLASGGPVTRFSGERRLFFSRWGQRLELCIPLRAAGRAIGAVRVVSPLEGLRLSLWGSWRLIILFALLDGLVIALFGGYLLRRRVVGPVERLAQAATSYAAGGPVPDLADVQGAGEIEALARSLEAMLAGLARAAREREEYVGRLEEAMRQLRAAQQELLRSEKLAVVGQLAAGVAHEIGNPISSILGYTELLLSGEAAAAGEADDNLQRIQAEVERIDHIVRGLLDLARPQACRLEDVSLNPLVDEAAELVGHRKGGGVRIEKDLAQGLPPVRADRAQLVQVLLNLMLNGLDAMGEAGTLRLATRVVEPSAGELEALSGPSRRRDDPPGADFSHLRSASAAPAPPEAAQFVEVEVSDTGCGIEPERLPRVFDPFYTTKPPGAGTGLGLAISLRIVRSFGGSIGVESRPGEGSRFRVLLPVGEEAAK